MTDAALHHQYLRSKRPRLQPVERAARLRHNVRSRSVRGLTEALGLSKIQLLRAFCAEMNDDAVLGGDVVAAVTL